MAEVEGAMQVALNSKSPVLLMQCNTEYTSKITETREQKLNRFQYINLRVLETYAKRWPGVPLGLSRSHAWFVNGTGGGRTFSVLCRRKTFHLR
jgi:sialic acid synthase SpsE